MKLKSWLTGLTGAVTLGVVALPAEAAPAGGLSAAQGAAAAPTADVQQAHWYGRRYGYRPYYYGYGPRRYGYYGYRPDFRFHYGPRYHRRHWHYRHW